MEKTIEIQTYIEQLFTIKGVKIAEAKKKLFDEFVQEALNTEAVQTIIEQQSALMDKWQLKNHIADIIAKPLIIPNATCGKSYQAQIKSEQLDLDEMIFTEWKGLQEIGLHFNAEHRTIEGTPGQSGELKFTLLFKTAAEDKDTAPHEKIISLVVNPDPKTLWKNLPSDREGIFWKEDHVQYFGKLGGKHVVASSDRGRSHQNAGSFRDDDMAFKHIESIGWSVAAVSDGAGSYSMSRKGAQIACTSVIDYFENQLDQETFQVFENKINQYNSTRDVNLLKEIDVLSKQNLYKAVLYVHNKIKETAEQTRQSDPAQFQNPRIKNPIDYFHATLIFTLFKKYEFGYVVLSFGVGDCPIAIMNTEQTETTLLNWLDVGEFGGGTRFITQGDIFHSKEHPMVSRFNFKIYPDFSYLFMMTDGIYDPKFVVEANLEKHENWITFLEDLKGQNEENTPVELSARNPEITHQMSRWMEFWSTGNHDDRTLAIIF
ncbi:protein phosphatase 2C domain-containing protein [Sphingobacterium spiritivorum]|uniref:protein phosphatase 2C domain-containing protein n=1 Tax=Sphingobacterium spiritivorum TaxID=258 RepID=UPI003DA59D8C